MATRADSIIGGVACQEVTRRDFVRENTKSETRNSIPKSRDEIRRGRSVSDWDPSWGSSGLDRPCRYDGAAAKQIERAGSRDLLHVGSPRAVGWMAREETEWQG